MLLHGIILYPEMIKNIYKQGGKVIIAQFLSLQKQKKITQIHTNIQNQQSP